MPAESDAVIAILTGVSVGLILLFTCLCCVILKYKTFVWDTKTHHHELQMKDSKDFEMCTFVDPGLGVGIEQTQRLSLRSNASSDNANNQDIESMDTSLQGVKIEG